MNYWNKHLGDYLRDAGHLTLLEHGVYNRLLDLYYLREYPLPEFEQCCRLVGARSPEELAAVKVVLTEFFIQTDEGWEHSRCEREILLYQDRVAKAKANGSKGGRPPKGIANPNQEITQSVSYGLAAANPDQTQAKAHQPPTTNHQLKDKTVALPRSLSLADLLADGLTQETALEWMAHRKRKRAALTPLAWKGIKDEAAKAGWTVEAAVGKALARGWIGFEAEWLRNDRPNKPDKTVITSRPDDDKRYSWGG